MSRILASVFLAALVAACSSGGERNGAPLPTTVDQQPPLNSQQPGTSTETPKTTDQTPPLNPQAPGIACEPAPLEVRRAELQAVFCAQAAACGQSTDIYDYIEGNGNGNGNGNFAETSPWGGFCAFLLFCADYPEGCQEVDGEFRFLPGLGETDVCIEDILACYPVIFSLVGCVPGEQGEMLLSQPPPACAAIIEPEPIDVVEPMPNPDPYPQPGPGFGGAGGMYYM